VVAVLADTDDLDVWPADEHLLRHPASEVFVGAPWALGTPIMHAPRTTIVQSASK
jgi:hypothetical protein